ncbi:hypothetical protein [Oceanobacillus saliphilus]|uniref:hypothetical protein n=1 Tax=Oceanobacillus saliphilus TaxID=2925834 RepID=UPI00201E14BE|nr:hypothetical protein [Oceanobacillus saliphilus]
MRQRSALAQVGSPAAREKRSIFPRAMAEAAYLKSQFTDFASVLIDGTRKCRGNIFEKLH